jgi:hypothetical protein
MSTDPNGYSVFLAKLAPDGTCSWLKQLQKTGGNPYCDRIYRMDVSPQGELFLGGFAPGALQYDNTSIPVKQGVFVAAFDTDANLMWHNQPASTCSNCGVQDISVAANNAVYMVANFQDSIIFGKDTVSIYDPAPPYYDGPSPGHALVMINNGKLTTGIDAVAQASTLEIFPNPNEGKFALNLQEDPTSIQLFDIRGQQVSCIYSRQEKMVRMENCVQGVYFLRVVTAKETRVSRVVVQR